MRSIAALRTIASCSTILTPARVGLRPAVARLPARQHLSTSTLLLKKSKAAAAKRRHAEEADEDTDSSDKRGGRSQESTENEVGDVLAKTERKMEKAVDWARVTIYEMVERGRGRVTPALLDGVKVTTPDEPGAMPLNNVASVTVKGHALMVSVWDTAHTKLVSSAIHAANLPGLSPIKIDDSTLKIPVSKPSHEQRQALLKQIAQTVESAKTQVRSGRTDGLNGLGGRGEPGADDVQKLANDFGGQLDQLLSQAKKEFEKV